MQSVWHCIWVCMVNGKTPNISCSCLTLKRSVSVFFLKIIGLLSKMYNWTEHLVKTREMSVVHWMKQMLWYTTKMWRKKKHEAVNGFGLVVISFRSYFFKFEPQLKTNFYQNKRKCWCFHMASRHIVWKMRMNKTCKMHTFIA